MIKLFFALASSSMQAFLMILASQPLMKDRNILFKPMIGNPRTSKASILLELWVMSMTLEKEHQASSMVLDIIARHCTHIFWISFIIFQSPLSLWKSVLSVWLKRWWRDSIIQMACIYNLALSVKYILIIMMGQWGIWEIIHFSIWEKNSQRMKTMYIFALSNMETSKE